MTREGSVLLQHSWYLPTQETTNVSKWKVFPLPPLCFLSSCYPLIQNLV